MEIARGFCQTDRVSHAGHAENKADIKELQEQVHALAEEMREVRYDIRRDCENAAHEHEKLLLRLEVALLRAERRTLTGKSGPGLLLEEKDEIPPEQ